MSFESEENRACRERVWAHWSLINALAAVRFHKETESENAALYVIDALAENDWYRIRRFSGRSRFKTYLSSVVYRLLEDYARKKFGRKKIPTWIEKLGGVWMTLFRLLCFERFPFVEAVMRAGDCHVDLDSPEIEQVAETIVTEIPDCAGHPDREIFHDEQFGTGMEHELSVQQHQTEQQEKRLITKALFRELVAEENSNDLEGAITKMMAHQLKMTAEEKLLLQLCHRDGLNVASAGRMIGLNRYQAHGKLRRLYAKIRKSFCEAGYDTEIKVLLYE
ncbi:MAG: hypothetical protein CSA26_04580 [Desulfobacterales bacterium]|nr:MAG: hypothetical protein CSA26_04580 [Desulfobacterales bacterium]